MEFWKMNGAGNDFIVIDDRQDAVPANKWPDLARTLCERHLSIGADGLMVVKRPTCGGDYRMLFFNSDGSMGEMCGNGARCICRYGYENGLAGPVQRVETTAGLVTGWRMDRRQYRVRLNDPCHLRLDGTAEVDGAVYDCAYVELGDPGIPHAVVPMQGLQDCDTPALFRLGRRLRHSQDFPKGANVNLCAVTAPDTVRLVTFERGVEDFTLACGTGVGSTVFALTRRGLVSGRGVRVLTDGGTLLADTDGVDLDLTGPAQRSFVGEFDDSLYLL